MRRALTSLLLLTALLHGCSRNHPAFTLWIGGAPQEVDYWEILVKQFERRSGVHVNIVRQPTDSDQRRQGLVISLESRQPDPDVFLMDVVWIGQFALSHWLEPLNPYTEDTFSVQPFFQRVLRLVDTYADTLFALPVYVDGGLLYYRTDLLHAYGIDTPPETWDELRHEAGRIQEAEQKTHPGFNGFVWQGAQYEGLVCTFLEFASSHDGGIASDDTVLLSRAANAVALEFMRDLIHRYHISPPNTYTEMKEEEVRRSFQQGNALFERNWPYAWSLHQSADSPVKGLVGIAPLPHFAGGESASTLGGWHIGISRYSDKKVAAWEFVKFITSYETQKNLALHLGWNPGRSDVYTDAEVQAKLPHLVRLKTVFDHAVARPNLPYYTQVSEVIQRYVNDCLAGTMDASTALRHMQREIHDVTDVYAEH